FFAPEPGLSYALEELGLAHIINAEAEKIQYALGTLSGLSPAATLDEILAVNESVNKTIQSALKTQMLLQTKLDSVIQTPVLTGPPGPTGPTGPAGGPTGPSGATGVTGTSGPVITANNAHMVTSDIISVNNNTGIPLSQNLVLQGTAITHTPGTAQINLAPNQTYFATYEVQGEIPSGGLVQVQFERNGGLVGGTQSRATGTTGDNASLSSSAIIVTGAGSQVLELVNTSGQATNFTGTNINIIKLA
ncbi:hypothetical protein, partial [Bacillus cereus]